MTLVRPIEDIELSTVRTDTVTLRKDIWYELRVTKINDIESLNIIIPDVAFPANVAIIKRTLLDNYFVTREEDIDLKIKSILE